MLKEDLDYEELQDLYLIDSKVVLGFILGRSQDFSKGGGHTVSNIIVMGFSPRNIVGCLLKKGLQRGWGGGVTGTPGPPSLRPCYQ